MNHYDFLFNLAKEAKNGVIVELGACRGNGTEALFNGAAEGECARIYAIDDYKKRKGWIGENYGPDNRDAFQSRLDHLALGHDELPTVVLLESDILKAASDYDFFWKEGIALLVWDLGIRDRIVGDFAAWQDLVNIDGTFMIKDTTYYDLGSYALIESAHASGSWGLAERSDGISVLRRLK